MALVDCFTRVFAYVQILARGRESGLVVSDETAYGVVRQDVEALIAQGEEQAAAAGTDRELFRQAEFAVCCWIDETLLAADWPGRDEWLKRPLQRTQFNTINGGEEFFSRMDAAQNLDNMELVEVFHACISLGFTGRYYQENQKALLDEISLAQAKRLYGDFAQGFSGTRGADGHSDANRQLLFPDAYANNTSPSKRPLRAYRFLDPGMLFMFIVPGLLLLGLYIYYRFELNRLLAQMLDAV